MANRLNFGASPFGSKNELILRLFQFKSRFYVFKQVHLTEHGVFAEDVY